jgi:hypothetical protein
MKSCAPLLKQYVTINSPVGVYVYRDDVTILNDTDKFKRA